MKVENTHDDHERIFAIVAGVHFSTALLFRTAKHRLQQREREGERKREKEKERERERKREKEREGLEGLEKES